MESKSCPHNDEPFEFSITVDENSKSPVNIKDTGEKEKILHITDIHYDPNYEVDGNSKCDEPMCCRIGQNSTNTNGKLAGYWGDYNWCDLPWHSIENALKHIKMTHQVITLFCLWIQITLLKSCLFYRIYLIFTSPEMLWIMEYGQLQKQETLKVSKTSSIKFGKRSIIYQFFQF